MRALLATAAAVCCLACSYDFQQYVADGSALGGSVGSGGAAGPSGGATAGGTANNGGTTNSGGTTSSRGGAAATGGATTSGGSAAVSCSGPEFGGACWYLGQLFQSCTEVCADHGGTSPEAVMAVGVTSQGGSASECSQILALLGVTGSESQGTRNDGLGLGCHVVSQGTRQTKWWLSSPAYSADAREAGTRNVCGCSD